MSYQSHISGHLLNRIQTGIYQKIVIEGKFKDANYSAAKLADDLGVDKRYISATLSMMYNTTYNQFVNRHRIALAVTLLTDKRHKEICVEDIGTMVGFANRQTFHVAFKQIIGTTPLKYKAKMMGTTDK